VSNYEPAFSPDGRSIAYIANPGDQLNVRKLAAGSQARQLTHDDCCYIGSPAFSPDGKSILYTFADGVIPETTIRSVSLGDDTTTTVHAVPTLADGLDVAPDGRTVAFTTWSNPTCIEAECGYRNAQTSLMKRNGSSAHPLTGALNSANPSFSPDGKRIAFSGRSTESDDPWQIYSVRVDGTDLTRLTNGTLDARKPVYSPDGRKIAYSTTDSLVVMSASGSGARNVAPSSLGTLADWQRRAPFVVRKMPAKRRTLPVKVFGPGRLIVSSDRVKLQVRRVSSAGTVRVPIRPRFVMKQLLAVMGKASTNVEVTFEPKGALPNTIKRRLVLKR